MKQKKLFLLTNHVMYIKFWIFVSIYIIKSLLKNIFYILFN